MSATEDPGPDLPRGLREDESEQSEYKAGAATSLESGIAAIASTAKTLPNGPGVYRMLDEAGEALYVGKARDLQKRVSTYTQIPRLPRRLQRMVAQTVSLEVVRTNTEVEALLLESNLIKRLRPRYNVLLRDDKSFPYILITGDHAVPQITKHRGAQSREGDYYGPFASAGAVNRTITALERAFLLRSCSDAVFASRSRPCLMYQIKRCSAPCVDRISAEDYRSLVAQARSFLTGQSTEIRQRLSRAMEEASESLDFESAATYRDRIRSLAHIQAHQDINVEGVENADIVAAFQQAGQTCIQIFFFRAGRNYGNRAYYPGHDKSLDAGAVLTAFVSQFYENKPVPKQLLTSHPLTQEALIAEALSLNAGHKVEILTPQRGGKKKLVDNAKRNAEESLARRLAESNSQRRLLESMAEIFGLDAPPARIEVYDNSHTQGSNAYGAMIVAGPDGFIKNAYRKFRIKGKAEPDTAPGTPSETRTDSDPTVLVTEDTDEVPRGGDDYAMMREVLTRRLSRALKEDPEQESGQWPDLILLDGGRGQLSIGLEVLAELGLDDLPIAAVAKGPDRNAGRERIFLPDAPPLLLEPRDPVLYYIQRLRDEAHRFAIGTHRAGRTKGRLRSTLDDIPGIGAKRKRALLHHFGSAAAVARAGLTDLESVDGISRTIARLVYEHFNSSA